MNTNKSFAIFILVGVIIILLTIGGYFIFNKKQESITQQPIQTSTTTGTSPVLTPTPTTQKTNMIVIPTNTFVATVINDQYGLFTTNPANHPEPFTYFNDGIINTGEYTGYQRIIAQEFDDGRAASVWNLIFATKDYKTFVIDNSVNSQQVLNILAMGGDKWGIYMNTAKVNEQGSIPIEFPENIKLGLFNLKNTYPHYTNISTLDKATTADRIELRSSVPGLRFFYLNQPDADAQYGFSSYMSVVVEDSAGVVEMYSLSI